MNSVLKRLKQNKKRLKSKVNFVTITLSFVSVVTCRSCAFHFDQGWATEITESSASSILDPRVQIENCTFTIQRIKKRPSGNRVDQMHKQAFGFFFSTLNNALSGMVLNE